MHAEPGDWLVIERSDIEHHARRGRIEQVRGAGGTPPFVVRWLDTDRVVLVFPGPDGHVVSAADLAAADAAANARFTRVQREISAHPVHRPEES
ncbi:protein of unknown function [Actinokineospora alba]|uniref:DUF1918 domain-containing protein n=1 Tax=Actinokineospora alba TaxID=504798 RepID=A0A1H0FM48_9PSEU|nr:DUF1918 domain-containing protein [Actinokineospora alba]TDP69530.1 uncharacterized protein DUF1918 [Actinokineospora alba]SDI14828.1 protein of unknown function [Actinokineospora alba]SDN95581.1 protein of unknown function [Actinokineospora alba]